ncbi:MAG: alpha-1,4-glucan--maltose-1-phosphate maltosyltransferase [Actinomycetota bacterium]
MVQKADERARVVIERVAPELDCGRFPIKRTAGERVVVEADVFADGHDLLACVLRYRRHGEDAWQEAPMQPLVNDRWRGSFAVGEMGRCRYTIQAWIDRWGTWRRDLLKKVDAGVETEVDLQTGAALIDEAARRAARRSKSDAELLRGWSRLVLEDDEPATAASDPQLSELMTRYDDRRFAATYGRELEVTVDRERARFSSWYEMFPRSSAAEPGRHATLADVEARLGYVAGMGFDILYLPPIHPIGRTHRKGPNNEPEAAPGDVGSPWAIGSEEGGHDAVHPDLGTIDDFDRLVKAASAAGLEVALDLAYQCAPDHPWVREHPEWFRHRPDGSIQYAENPPKKYQDIYPIDFECKDWEALWNELRRVVEFWMDHGVRIFRVDNPHTKSFRFWEWLISGIKAAHPEVLFLSEAFTRPKVMYRLAKLGFTQSYTYFAWRNAKWELESYLTELTQTEVREFFRPSFWPNTPDILTEHMQTGGRPAFMARLVLAATMAASYGIYGPAFELIEHRAIRAGSEEHLDSEKYQVRHWNIDRPDSLGDLIARVNRVRRESPALHSNEYVRLHGVDNSQLIVYSKRTADHSNVVLVVVNLDPYHVQCGWLSLDEAELGVEPGQSFEVHDMLTGARYLWQGPRNYVELNPQVVPAHILAVHTHRMRSEADFEYFL